jgi:hypothetical protein
MTMRFHARRAISRYFIQHPILVQIASGWVAIVHAWPDRHVDRYDESPPIINARPKSYRTHDAPIA